MKKLVILMGLQGSGKSTFYQKHLSKDFVRVNLDTLKTRHRERALIEKCLREGASFAVDNTNPTKEDRARYIPAAKAEGYRVIGYFLGSEVRDCLVRNARREGKARVPDVAIFGTSKRLERPAYAEGFDELYFVHNDDAEMIISEWAKPYEI